MVLYNTQMLFGFIIDTILSFAGDIDVLKKNMLLEF